MGKPAIGASQHRTREPISRREEWESPMHSQGRVATIVADAFCFTQFRQLPDLASLGNLLPACELTACRLHR